MHINRMCLKQNATQMLRGQGRREGEGGGGTQGYYPGARAKKGPGHKLLQIYKYCKI